MTSPNIPNEGNEMDCETILERACCLPRDFFEDGSKSTVQLVQEGGIREHPDCLSVPAIKSVLRRQPELVAWWQRWSENKRVSAGWYFLEDDGEFVLGYFPDGKEQRYADALDACAEFVLRELKSLLTV